MARTLEFPNRHAPWHEVRVIQAENARKGIIAMVVAGVLAIVATLGVYAATTLAHERALDRTLQR